MASFSSGRAFRGCKDPLTGDGAADTPGITRRSAVAADVVALVALDGLCFGPQAWPRDVWSEVVREPEWTVTLLTAERTIVAVSVLLVQAPTSHLASLAVHPGWRRRGLATRLLREAISSARAGARWLALEVDCDNDRAVRLYRDHGFLGVRRFREDGRWRLEMVRRLAPAAGRPRT